MPRKTSKAAEKSRIAEKTCPTCKGKGTMTETQVFNKPSGKAYEYTGEFSHRKRVTKPCIRCGGRGTIRFWVDREV